MFYCANSTNAFKATKNDIERIEFDINWNSLHFIWKESEKWFYMIANTEKVAGSVCVFLLWPHAHEHDHNEHQLNLIETIQTTQRVLESTNIPTIVQYTHRKHMVIVSKYVCECVVCIEIFYEQKQIHSASFALLRPISFVLFATVH